MPRRKGAHASHRTEGEFPVPRLRTGSRLEVREERRGGVPGRAGVREGEFLVSRVVPSRPDVTPVCRAHPQDTAPDVRAGVGPVSSRFLAEAQAPEPLRPAPCPDTRALVAPVVESLCPTPPQCTPATVETTRPATSRVARDANEKGCPETYF